MQNMRTSEEINITSRKEKQRYLLLVDEPCEPLAYPNLLPTGNFGYKIDEDINLSSLEYFDQ